MTTNLFETRPQEVVIDLLFASSGIEPVVVAEALRLEIAPDVVVPVASPGHLFALKLLSADPKTRPQAVRLIEKRGFHRERDLDSLMEEWLG